VNKDKTVTINDLRPDKVKPSLPREEVLKKAKEHDGTYYVVPLVLAE